MATVGKTAGDTAVIDALGKDKWSYHINGTPQGDIYRLGHKISLKLAASLIYARSQLGANQEQLVASALLSKLLPKDTLGVDPSTGQDVYARDIIDAVLAPGAQDSTLVRELLATAREIAASPAPSPSDESQGERFDEIILNFLHGNLKDPLSTLWPPEKQGKLPRRHTSAHLITHPWLVSIVNDGELYDLAPDGMTLILNYLDFIREVYSSGDQPNPSFLANRSLKFMENNYPGIYRDFNTVAPQDRAKVAHVIEEMILEEGSWDRMGRFILNSLDVLTPQRILAFHSLVDEYNVEWAIAAFDWGAGESSASDHPAFERQRENY